MVVYSRVILRNIISCQRNIKKKTKFDITPSNLGTNEFEELF